MPAMYADDTNLSVTGTSATDVEMKLNCELELVHDWLVANKLTLNVEKTEYMIIGSYKKLSNIQNQSEIKIKLGGKEITRTNATKSLGVIIDEHLRWKEQIDSISTKVSRAIGIIRRVKKCFTRYVRANVLFLSSPVF